MFKTIVSSVPTVVRAEAHVAIRKIKYIKHLTILGRRQFLLMFIVIDLMIIYAL